MNTIRITTTQNIDLEYDLASVGERIVARLIDGLIFVAYFILLFSIIGFGSFEKFISANVWVFTLLSFPFVFYNLACEVLMNGQSVGKRVMNIKVISLSGNQSSISQYMIRWLFRLLDIYMFSGVIGFLAVAFSEKKQRIGDMVAGTVVIKTIPRSSIQHTIYAPVSDLNYNVTFPEVSNLSDRDMQLIKEVIVNVNKTGNSALAYQAAEKIKNLLQVQSDLDPMYFLQVLMADYNHITSRD